MNFDNWLTEGRLRPHQTSKQEIEDLLAVADRDLADAAIESLSLDRRFLITYDAAITLATIPLYVRGYETHGQGHHWLIFKALPQVMGEELKELSEYFDLCRTKRNVSTYDRGGQITEKEVEELIAEVHTFRRLVRTWLNRNEVINRWKSEE